MKQKLLQINDRWGIGFIQAGMVLPVVCWFVFGGSVAAQDSHSERSFSSVPNEATVPDRWYYGAYFDLSYPLNLNFPENHLWRNRSTVPRTNELAPDMALAYVQKKITAPLNSTTSATDRSRWGAELAVQAGYDTKDFAFLPGEPKISGADTLRHIGLANVSYLAPVGSGLALQAGLFNSLLGYESLYAKDNINYTRAWQADYSPYLMFGLNARYHLNERVEVAAYIINGYAHLARPNDAPSYGMQVVYKPGWGLNVAHTVYAGPDQSDTALQFWRYYLNNIVTWERDDILLALSYDAGTENIAGRPGNPRAFVMAGNITARWRFAPRWYVAVRPELYWDRNGRWTGSEQFVKAMTVTLDFAPFVYDRQRLLRNWHARLEYRWDDSTGVDGGFYKGGDISPGVPQLAPSQQLLILALLWTFDWP
ncbi:hypothetical protein YTPLAS18_37910 [Nitrospira sp.]|nr:hypothetical protein YTPLAS18_37910 [Nitrospira sp.]